MTGSQQLAIAAALTYLKIPFKTFIQVASTEPGMPAAGVLSAGDVIATVNGAPIDSLTALSGQIRDQPIGSPLKLTVIRNGKTIPLVIRSMDSQGHAEIGVVVTDKYKFPFNITIHVGNIGGPSAGMMFALGIIDKLGSVNLTGGRFIAGTGRDHPEGRRSADRRYTAEDGAGPEGRRPGARPAGMDGPGGTLPSGAIECSRRTARCHLLGR